MSEYQYYEFRALGHRLDSRQMAELRQLSTRARITPTGFMNEYHFGSFGGSPERMVEKYFDAFVYVANWGTHQMILRVPEGVFETGIWEPCSNDSSFRIWRKDGFVLVGFLEREVATDTQEATGWMDVLLPLWTELLDGDQRALYLGWLQTVKNRHSGDREPPVPAGLRNLTQAQRRLIEFLKLNTDLVAAAAETSPEEPPEIPEHEFGTWLAGLPEWEKDGILLRVATGQDRYAASGLLRRFRAERRVAIAVPSRRTVGDLLAAAGRYEDERQRREAEAARRREQQHAAERALYLDQLAEREPATWAAVERHVASRLPAGYTEAVTLLQDLRDLADRQGNRAAFQQRLGELRRSHAAKRSLLKRLDNAGLQ